MRGVLLAIVGAMACAAADEDPVVVLMGLRDQVLEHGQRVPNHTCVETVVRDRYAANAEQAHKSCDSILARGQKAGFSKLLRLATTDRLRLDVAFSGDREIYSWAGASRFEEGDIDALIRDGAMGTGPFAALLLGMFADHSPKFRFEGGTTVAGRPVFEYSFHVPKDDSHYSYKANGQWILTAYTGTLLVDPMTSELVRMTVRTDELPHDTDACEVDTDLEYGTVQLNGGAFLLPRSTRQRFIGRDGAEAENRYTFASCRDFQAQSSIRFGAGARQEDGATPGGGAVPPEWPWGLPVAIELTTPVDSDRAAAGDAVEGRLAHAVRAHDQAVLAPQGARVKGRLMRVEVRHGSSAVVVVAFRWETLEADGVTTPLSLIPNRQVKSGLQLGGLAALARLKKRGMEIELPLPGEEHCAIVRFPGERHVVESGLRTEWFTVGR
jgi:hypothetical protein